MPVRQRASMPDGRSAAFNFSNGDESAVNFYYDDGTKARGSIQLDDVEVVGDKPQWMKDKEAYDRSISPLNPNADMLKMFSKAFVSPVLNFISPSQQYGAITRANTFQDYWNKLGNGTNGVVLDEFAEDHPYLSMAANIGADAGIGAALGTLNLGQVKSFLKHPLYKTYYHSSPIQFNLSEAYIGTPYDMGLHMTDSKSVAFGPLSHTLGGKYVYKFRAPRHSVTTSDIGSNGVGHLFEDYLYLRPHKGVLPYNDPSLRSGTLVSPLDGRLVKELSNKGVYLDKTFSDGMYRARGVHGAKINMRSRFQNHVKDPVQFNKAANKIQADYEDVQRVAASNNFIHLKPIYASINERAAKLLSDQGIKVVRYPNRVPGEGGGYSYWLNDPSKIDFIDLYTNGVGQQQFNFAPMMFTTANDYY